MLQSEYHVVAIVIDVFLLKYQCLNSVLIQIKTNVGMVEMIYARRMQSASILKDRTNVSIIVVLQNITLSKKGTYSLNIRNVRYF